MKCLIKEKIKKGSVVGFSDRRYAEIRGLQVPRRWTSARYENTTTGDMFFALSGGFCWPGEKPGFAVVLGIQETENKTKPLFKVLDELEEKDISVLVRGTFELWEKWGKNCATIPWQWYGNPEVGFNQFLVQFGREKGKGGYHLVYPPHWEEKNVFEIYCKTIYSIARQRRLHVGQNHRLRAAIDVISDRNTYKDNLEDHPAIAALGMVLTWMVEYEPWKLEDDHLYEGSYVSTIMNDNSENMFRASEAETMRYLGQDDDEETEYKVEPPERKELVSTI